MRSTCEDFPASFPKIGDLVNHIRIKHKPHNGLPHEALKRSGITCCTTCFYSYSSAKTCANHERDQHNAPTTTRPIQPPHQPSPHVHHNPDETKADFFTPTQQFFESLPLTSPKLHEVHTLACPSIPNLALYQASKPPCVPCSSTHSKI